MITAFGESVVTDAKFEIRFTEINELVARGKQEAEEAVAAELEVNLTYFKKWAKTAFADINEYKLFRDEQEKVNLTYDESIEDMRLDNKQAVIYITEIRDQVAEN